MKYRPDGFLSEKNIDPASEIFDYISELHRYLWRVINAVNPKAGGSLCDHADRHIEWLEGISPMLSDLYELAIAENFAHCERVQYGRFAAWIFRNIPALRPILRWYYD